MQNLFSQMPGMPGQQSQVQTKSSIPPDVVLDQLEKGENEILIQQPKRIPYRLIKNKNNRFQGTLEYNDGRKITYEFSQQDNIQMSSADSETESLRRLISTIAKLMKGSGMQNKTDNKYYVTLTPADEKARKIMEQFCDQEGLDYGPPPPAPVANPTKVVAHPIPASTTPTIKSGK